ncbi:MAG: hypothetical protein IJD14_07015 [Christensenellaceae bacterium]|nr:hypothetical protein [Christensenellaceae bacterium]
MHKWIIPSDCEGMKLSAYIAECFPDEDQKGIKALLNEGARINGKAARASQRIYTNDIVELYTEDTPYGFKTEVIYDDENLFVVNKEQNISCYTVKGDISPALYDFAEQYMIDRGEYNVDAFSIPYICHGIDTRTGGLVIIAKDEIIYHKISSALKERRIKKHYTCIVAGVPEKDGDILHDYMLSKGKFDKLTIAKNTMRGTTPICLKYKLIATNGEFSLLEVELVTDHIAQICAQLALHELPVLGDSVYGNTRINAKTGVKLPALWASKLEFDVGKSGFIEYLDNTFIEAEYVGLPYIEGIWE